MDSKLLLEQAVSHHRKGRLKQAEKLYQRAFYAGADEARAFHLYGLLLIQGGRPDRAVRQLRRAIGRAPEHGPYHADLGNALSTVGRYDEAQAAYEQSLRCGADRPSVLANMGVLMTRRGRLDQAVTFLEQATALAPDSAQPWHQLGRAYRLRQDPERAENCLRTALTIDAGSDQGSADLHNELGLALAAQQRFEEAAQSFRGAITQQSDHAAAWCNLGNTLKQQDKFDDAVGAYRAALRARTPFPEALNPLNELLASSKSIIPK